MADIKNITIDGTTYDLKDAKAREDVSDLKEDLSALQDGYDTISYTRILNKGFDRSDGTFPDESNWDITDYIPVIGGETLYIDNPLASSAYNGWYTEDKTYIDWFTVVKDSNIEKDVPANAAYMVLTNNHTKFDYTVRRKAQILATREEVLPLYVNGEYEYEDGYLNSDGDISSAGETTQEITSEFIVVKPTWVIDWEMRQTSQVAKWCAFCFYDANYDLVGSRSAYTPSLETDIYRNSITVPSGAKYMRFSYRTYGNAVTITIHEPVSFDVYRLQSDFEDANINLVSIQNIVSNSHVKSINHRGYNTIAPENTMSAFKESVKRGFRYIETDVAFTSDGVAVLLHDDTINRTARNADGTEVSETVNIYDITYAQSQTYDFGIWKGAEYEGEKIPTLAQFLAFCKNTGVHPYIEIKYSTGWTQSQVLGILDIIKSCGMYGKCTIISFVHGYLTAWIEQDSHTRIGVLSGTADAETIAYAVSLKTSTNEVFLDAETASASVIESCISNGIPVELWTLNTASDIESMDDYISGVTSDSLIASVVLYNASMI